MSALDLSESKQQWTPDDTSWPCPWKAGSVIGAGRCREWQAECPGCPRALVAIAVVRVAMGGGKAASRHRRMETVACVECSRPFERIAENKRRRTTCSPSCWLARRQRRNAERYARLAPLRGEP